MSKSGFSWREQPNAPLERSRSAADLEKEEGWPDAVAGCDVLHVAAVTIRADNEDARFRFSGRAGREIQRRSQTPGREWFGLFLCASSSGMLPLLSIARRNKTGTSSCLKLRITCGWPFSRTVNALLGRESRSRSARPANRRSERGAGTTRLQISARRPKAARCSGKPRKGETYDDVRGTKYRPSGRAPGWLSRWVFLHFRGPRKQKQTTWRSARGSAPVDVNDDSSKPKTDQDERPTLKRRDSGS